MSWALKAKFHLFQYLAREEALERIEDIGDGGTDEDRVYDGDYITNQSEEAAEFIVKNNDDNK